ncbi:MAG TPA: WD40 repeat domain-containing protein, partial [Saprospiraceae bacterium]|nr:WD40 repeat domain-containing protein [Saprospiraceae bacterium]
MRTLFFLLATCLIAAPAAAQTGRRYMLRDTFLRMSSEKCYDLTREEGERAFRARDWETAANLFRAAKNCADADQRKRSLMSQRIGDSRRAAIDELVEKEREAIRTARHALATNRANDALVLLKDSYRSWAFRLADFADRYIAPPDGEPNVQTRQAMLDAWNYIPYYHSWMRDYPNMRVPFCYQVAENLPITTQIQYHQWLSGGKLYAFSPQEHLLRAWSDDLAEAADPIRLDTAFIGFEAAPDGRTLLFYSPKRLVLWRSPTQTYSIDISDKRVNWAFNAEGNTFYYLEGQGIYGVSLARAFGTRGGKYVQRNMRNGGSGDFLSGSGAYEWDNIDPVGLLGFGVKNDRLYLAYTDQVLVLRHDADTAAALRMPYALPDDTGADQVRLWLNDRLLTYANDTLFVQFRLPAADTGAITQASAYAERAVAHNPRMLVTRELARDATRSRAFFREMPDEVAHFVRHDAEELDKSVWHHAHLTTDGSRLAVITGDGSLRVFELDRAANGSTLPYFQTQGQPLQFCPDGTHFAVRGPKSLDVFATERPDEPAFARPLADPEGGVLALGNQFAVLRLHADSTMLWHFPSGKTLRMPVDGTAQSFCLSTDERLLAYTDQNLVKVMDVERGTVTATYPENNLEVFDLAFVPNTNRLMLVARNYDSDVSYGVDIKFWDVARPNEEPKLLLISDLQQVMPLVALSPDSRWVALMDGKSTRIFDLDNLSEEHTSLQGQKWEDAVCSAMTFSLDSRMLVMGYSDGHTVAWDIATRRPAYRLAPPVTKAAPVMQLLFTDGGASLRQVLVPAQKMSEQTLRLTNTYTERLLDVATMRQYLSNGERQLAALSPEQILKYDLESALSYPGNFERLAQSGDLPLIRSFFDFYQRQALQSNNSSQVRQYCERAFQLYQQLDADNRDALRTPMLAMYDDLIWKLIQRNKPDEAAQTVQQVGRHFDQPLSLTRWNGHIALLRGDAYLRTAATHYANWIMRSAEEERVVDKYDYKKGEYTVFMQFYEQISQELNRLNTYRLLQGPQQQMLCALLGDYTTLGFCAALSEGPATQLPLEPATQQQWRIFQLLNNSEAAQDFRPALEDARR